MQTLDRVRCDGLSNDYDSLLKKKMEDLEKFLAMLYQIQARRIKLEKLTHLIPVLAKSVEFLIST